MDDKAQLVTEEDRRLLRRVGDLLEEVIGTLEITGNPETMREVEEARRDAREGRVRDYSELEEATVDYEYRGVVVKGVKALRCPRRGEEVIDVEEYGKIKRRVESFIKPLKLRRRISAAGRRPAVYLPEDVVQAAKVKIGDEVDIYTEGNRIVIEPVLRE